jgi:hypothetical protein
LGKVDGILAHRFGENNAWQAGPLVAAVIWESMLKWAERKYTV